MSNPRVLNEAGVKSLMEANGYEVPTRVTVTYEIQPVWPSNKRHILLMSIIKNLEAEGMVFGRDPHTLSYELVRELTEWASSVRYTSASESSMGQGRMFYQYLSKLRQVYT